MQQLTILGSTGHIGQCTLSVVASHRERFSVLSLVAKKNVAQMIKQCLLFRPRYVGLLDEKAAKLLRQQLKQCSLGFIEVLSGVEDICQLAALPQADQVIAAIVGVAGLLPTLAAVRAGKRVLLANKESLVTSGRFFMQAVRQYKAQLLPIDSEHNALFQCLPKAAQQKLGQTKLATHHVKQLVLTASGGPLRNLALSDLASVTPEQACAHPTWSMGRKISVDCATMMNKGLEYIEAYWLFNAALDEVSVVIHPQSIIHSMVYFIDNSVLAQCSHADMRIPISYAMAYPKRLQTHNLSFDFLKLTSLTFEPVCYERYPCVRLAMLACKSGQAASIILNAANEVTVAAFLCKQIPFLAISHIIRNALDVLQLSEPNSIEEVLHIDLLTRKWTKEQLAKIS